VKVEEAQLGRRRRKGTLVERDEKTATVGKGKIRRVVLRVVVVIVGVVVVVVVVVVLLLLLLLLLLVNQHPIEEASPERTKLMATLIPRRTLIPSPTLIMATLISARTLLTLVTLLMSVPRFRIWVPPFPLLRPPRPRVFQQLMTFTIGIGVRETELIDRRAPK
jgi:hypothetical protein